MNWYKLCVWLPGPITRIVEQRIIRKHGHRAYVAWACRVARVYRDLGNDAIRELARMGQKSFPRHGYITTINIVGGTIEYIGRPSPHRAEEV